MFGLIDKLAGCWKMGCVTSKKDINDLHPNIFQVSNVDDLGNRLSSGQLEVNETELVLYQRGKSPIRWPLKTLRRYGYDGQVFSFETGRRCPTGPGIYAFSCRRADKLFNFFQSHVQMRGEESGSRHESGTPGTTRPGDYLEPRPRISIHNGGASSRLSSVGSSNASPSPPPTLYANDIYRISMDEVAVSPTMSGESEEEILSPLYMNVGGLGVTNPVEEEPEEDVEEEKHCYENLTPGLIIPRPVSIIVPSSSRGSQLQPPDCSLHQEPQPGSPVNYIQLELVPPPSPPPAPPAGPSGAPQAPTEGYATIDFDKTVALSNSVNPTAFDNEGCRRTRHNSSTPRQSTSLSD